MPPPTNENAWLTNRRFGVVIDAGSSGSRLQIYSWKNPITTLQNGGDAVAYTLPQVEKGVMKGEDWVKKAEPGLSSFADNTDGIASYLAPLLEHARYQIPPSVQPETPLFLLATAGMRLLSATEQAKILVATCLFFKFHSNFKIDGPSHEGPCGSSVRIITGEEEGLFGWIAVNYLMDGFNNRTNEPTTYGFLDMGGASTQIAFEPSKKDRVEGDNLVGVRLRLLGGKEIHHEVFVTTWLGYGTNQARERYVGEIIKHAETDDRHPPTHSDPILDPCLPKDLELVESPVYIGASSNSHMRKAHTFRGSGSFEGCLKETAPLLNKSVPCTQQPCLFNGVHVPHIDFSVSRFVGVSEYWYSSEHVFGLGGAYDFIGYERAASQFCSRSWEDIKISHEKSRERHGHHLGGDGEIMLKGEVVGVGKWGNDVEISRLQMQCFKAAWVANVLHEGIGMPRIVDPGGNMTSSGGRKIEHQADEKGLGRPTFQSVDTVGDIAISWTLGKMVLEASKDVPLPSPGARPLTDPLDEIPQNTDLPIQPIRFPFLHIDGTGLENKITPHLPVALTRASLGFSPVMGTLYLIVVAGLCILAFRKRHSLSALFRRSGSARRDHETYSMEEGNSRSATSAPFYSILNGILLPVRRVGLLRKAFNSLGQPFAAHPSTRPPVTLRPSSMRNMMLNSPPPLRGTDSPPRLYQQHPIDIVSRSGTPEPNMLGSLASLSRSRNASQVSLANSTLASRIAPISRVASTSASRTQTGYISIDD